MNSRHPCGFLLTSVVVLAACTAQGLHRRNGVGVDPGEADEPRTVGARAATVEIVWPEPASIEYGTPLGPTQLNAVVEGDVPGTVEYAPGAGTVLPPGDHTLAVTFTPDDPQEYRETQATTVLRVTKRPLDVFVGDGTRRYGEPNPDFTLEFAGFLPGDSEDDLTIRPIPAPTDGLFPNPGDYKVQFIGGTDDLYSFRLAKAGTLTVENAIQLGIEPEWNLLAVPFDVSIASADPFLLPDENGLPLTDGAAWIWNARSATYVQSGRSLRLGDGVWVRGTEFGQSAWLYPDAPPPLDVDLPAGWSLIGLPYNCSLRQIQNGDRVRSAWRWNAATQVYEPLTETRDRKSTRLNSSHYS